MKNKLNILNLFDLRALKNIDFYLLGIVIAIMTIGFFNLKSISVAKEIAFQWKQLNWYVAGILLIVFLICFDYRQLSSSFAVYSSYFVTLLLLVAVFCIGKEIHGSRRWLFFFQPSELAKLTTIIVIAAYFHDHAKTNYSIKDLLKPTFLLLIPLYLILLQPDLGTALMIIILAVSIFLFAGIEWRSFLFLFSLAVSILPLVLIKHDLFFKSYQWGRIMAFREPERYATSLAYHTYQSIIAVGSGMLFGKGYQSGSQTQLSFLPEVQTDFAFAAWAEETGFVGSVLLLALFLLFFYRSFVIIYETRDRFGSFLAFGVAAMVFWQLFINTLMVVGWSPVVGLTFPLISYGGTSVLITCVGIGLLLSVSARRKMYFFR